MNNSNTSNDKYNYIEFISLISLDIFLGLMLGLTVNYLANYIGRIFKLNTITILIIQIIISVNVLYLVKIFLERYRLNSTWLGPTGYGVVFISVFIAVQINLTQFFENIDKFSTKTK